MFKDISWKPQTASYLSKSKSLPERSAIQTMKITSEELKALILQNKLSNDVFYQVEGSLDLTGCTGLTALPNSITTMGETRWGNTRHVYLDNTGLSDGWIEHLRTAPGMQFHSS